MSKNTDEQVELLKTNKGIDWHKFSDDKKFGRIVKKETFTHHFSNEPEETYERTKWVALPFFDMTDVDKRQEFINEFDLIDHDEKQ
jgi:hypothetical protein